MAEDEKVLGSGEYGVVFSGVFNGQAVAIKKLKRRVDVEEFKAVLAEMKIMSYLGDHENVVKFFGSDVSQIASCKFYAGVRQSCMSVSVNRWCFIVAGQITIVTELSPHGDLLHYLWKVGSGGLKIPQNRSAQQIKFLTFYAKPQCYIFAAFSNNLLSPRWSPFGHLTNGVSKLLQEWNIW